jgi:hypothetical protein
MSTVAFNPLTQAEQVFKDLVWDPMLKVGETWIEGMVPVLAWPVFKQIDEEAIQLITDYLFSQIVLVIDVETITLINDLHQSAFDKSSLKLKVVLHEKGVESDAYKQALAEELAAMSNFTHIGP